MASRGYTACLGRPEPQSYSGGVHLPEAEADIEISPHRPQRCPLIVRRTTLLLVISFTPRRLSCRLDHGSDPLPDYHASLSVVVTRSEVGCRPTQET